MSAHYARSTLIAFAVAQALLVAGLAPVAAQTANNRCPQIGQLPADASEETLRCLCFQACNGQPPPRVEKPAGSLTCGSIKALAFRASVGLPEGFAAQEQLNSSCPPGVPDSHVPPPPPAVQRLEGRYLISRGYTDRNPGADPNTCQREYREEAFIQGGTITFTGGGHTWSGAITDNNWVNISRDGVTPRPRNPTAITGPITNATLFNGYCGRGYFRIVGKI